MQEAELTSDKLAQLEHTSAKKVSSTVKSVKAPSASASAKKEVSQIQSNNSLANPRILVGTERTKFVTTVMDSTFHPEKTDQETVDISKKILSKVNRLVEQQKDPKHLEKQCLPKVPKAYEGPII